MADRKTSVDEMYANRHRPYGQVRDGSHRRIEHEPAMKSVEVQKNQAPEDAHDNRGGLYDNQVSGDSWLRGGGKSGATGKPGFDFGGAWRQKDKSISHGPGDPAVIRSPGKNTPDR